MEVEPFDSMISLEMRMAYGKSASVGMTGSMRALGERAVADLAAAGGAGAAGLAHAEGREVVMQDEALGLSRRRCRRRGPALRRWWRGWRGRAPGFRRARRARSRASAGARRPRRSARGADSACGRRSGPACPGWRCGRPSSAGNRKPGRSRNCVASGCFSLMAVSTSSLSASTALMRATLLGV